MVNKVPNRITMIQYYITSAIRGIKNNLAFSAVNWVGQGIGLASTILIFIYILNEIRFDTFHNDYDKIYRIVHSTEGGNEPPSKSAITFSRAGYELRESFPSVDQVVRIHKVFSAAKVRSGDNIFFESRLIGVDTNFFSVFNFPLIKGSRSQALKKPNSIVLTESMANKYFRTDDPLGKEIMMEGAYGFWTPTGLNDKITYIVTGVMKDLPKNTHFKFDFIVSFSLFSNLEGELNNWGDDIYTYIKINDNSQVPIIENGLKGIVSKYRADKGVTLSLQDMQGIHLNSSLFNEFTTNGNKTVLYLLLGVGILIILVASANYVNFATANAIKRQKEISVRKIYWATPASLFAHLMVESMVMNVCSFLLGLVFITSISSVISDLLGLDVVELLTDSRFWLVTLATVTLSTALSGIYPAIRVAKLKPITHVSDHGGTQIKIGGERKLLLALQFVICELAIGCSIILYSQLVFMKDQELGISIENTIVIDGPRVNYNNDSVYTSQLTSFRNEAERLASFANVSAANFIPGKEIGGKATGYVRKVGGLPSLSNTYYFTQVDYDFIKNFEIKIMAGRSFDRDYPSDMAAVVINKSACDLLGFKSPEEAIGKRIVYRMQTTPEIIGVIGDFHQQSLKEGFQPIILEVSEQADTYFFLKPQSNQKINMDQVSLFWNRIFPDAPLSFFFLQDYFDQQYDSDSQFTKVFGYFSFLAIFVSAIGFLCLIYFVASSKVKEIAIRRALGGNFFDIFMVLGRGIVVLTLMAGVIAIPLIYYISSRWLDNYIFRIDISLWMLLVPVLLLLLLALVIILQQTSASSKINPVTALREK